MHGRAIVAAMAAALLAAGALLAGCGATEDAAARLTGPSACEAAPEPQDANTLVVLVWEGGQSRQTGDRRLAAFDVHSLRFSDDSLNDGELSERFQAAVLSRVQVILCDLEPQDVTVVTSPGEMISGATLVHLVGDSPAEEARHIGQSSFDPCNAHGDDSAVIWGGALASRMPPLTFDQWVNVVANTTAHEIGHTLGFTHPDEATVARMLPQPSAEIMRANVKPSELAGEQYFLLEQHTCPGHEPGDGSYALIGAMAATLGD